MAPRRFFRHAEQVAQHRALTTEVVSQATHVVRHRTDPRERREVDRPVLLSVQDTATRLQVSRRTIYRALTDPDNPLPHTYVRSLIRIHEFELYAWLSRQGQAQPQRLAVVGGRK